MKAPNTLNRLDGSLAWCPPGHEPRPRQADATRSELSLAQPANQPTVVGRWERGRWYYLVGFNNERMAALRSASDGFRGLVPLFEFKAPTVEDFWGGTLSTGCCKIGPKNGLVDGDYIAVFLQGHRLSANPPSFDCCSLPGNASARGAPRFLYSSVVVPRS